VGPPRKLFQEWLDKRARENLKGLIGVYLCMETLRQIRLHFGLLIIIMAAMFGALLGFLAGRSIHTCSPVAGAYTPPLLDTTSFDIDGVVIEAYVDSKGRVWNYRVISKRPESERFVTSD
jgi:hypothetical protein